MTDQCDMAHFSKDGETVYYCVRELGHEGEHHNHSGGGPADGHVWFRDVSARSPEESR
jgi:hypothetical protein